MIVQMLPSLFMIHCTKYIFRKKTSKINVTRGGRNLIKQSNTTGGYCLSIFFFFPEIGYTSDLIYKHIYIFKFREMYVLQLVYRGLINLI